MHPADSRTRTPPVRTIRSSPAACACRPSEPGARLFHSAAGRSPADNRRMTATGTQGLPQPPATTSGAPTRATATIGRQRPLPPQHLPEAGRQVDILHVAGPGEERGDLCRRETGDAATDLGDEEGHFRMLPGKPDEVVDIGSNGLHAALHGRNGIALALQSDALPSDGAEALPGQPCGPATVQSAEIASEDKDFTGPQRGDPIRCRAHNDRIFTKIRKYPSSSKPCRKHSARMAACTTAENEKGSTTVRLSSLFFSRGDWIRTSDHTPPRRVL